MTTEEFKTGEYVVYLNGTYRIKNDGKHYILFSVNENTSTPVVHVQYGSSRLRLWTVQDAKDGDVLYLQHDGKEHIIIYKGVIKERFRTFVSAYCAYNGIVDAFCFADVSRYIDIAYGGIMPATKEQRDLLFQKMKEAGYEWDSHTKKIIEVTMATIDYKEKYMQALERARQFSEKPYLEDSAGIVEYIFPELKESEDRIRKALISFLKSPFVNENITDEKVAPWIAWLEKQGMPAKYHDICDTCVRQPTCQSDCFLQQSEQKPTDKVEPKFKVGDKIKLAKEPKYPAREIIAIKNDAYYFDELVHLPFSHQDEWELVEQKPSWSEEDKMMLQYAIEHFERQKRNCIEGGGRKKSMQEFIDWLKSLRPQNVWISVDEEVYVKEPVLAQKKDKSNPSGGFVVCYDHTLTPNVYERYMILGNIVSRNTWKPSEGQLEALKKACDEHWEPDGLDPLYTLYQDLKKLSEE